MARQKVVLEREDSGSVFRCYKVSEKPVEVTERDRRHCEALIRTLIENGLEVPPNLVMTRANDTWYYVAVR